MTAIADLYAARIEAGEIERDPAQEALLPALERARAEAEAPVPRGFLGRPRPRPAGGLYLWGGVGAGKSMLMDMLVAATDAPVRRVHFHAFMQEIHAGMHEVRKTGADDALAPVADGVAEGLRMLAFDEMQVGDITDAMILGRLFERIMDAGVTIVTTSNRPPGDLYRDGLNRALFLPAIAMIEARMEVVGIGSERDHRRGRLAGGEVWLTPLGPEARARIAEIWRRLAGGEGAPLALRVQGREVRLPAYASGVARASFWDLCGRPLGAADYLAIAEAVRVLVLEDVPRLGRSNFNEAKRFVTLIDALYEARVRLVASAADAPEALYVEGEGSFEFARTASRLREMASAGWGEAEGAGLRQVNAAAGEGA